jgi:replicative DNA helicase
MSDNGVSSAFFLTEDPAQAFQTMLCWETGIPHWNIRTGDLSDHQYRQVIESVSRLQDGLIHFENIVDNPTPHEVKRRATQLVKQHNIGLIVVDYVQLMEVVGKGYDNANARLSEISRQLSLMAGQLHVPVVVCSQLSRDSVKNQRAPELYDLRDSGSLEQDARWVIMLWHPYKVFIDDKGKITYPPDEAHIYVRKQNSGPTGMAKTYWHENMVRFENITQPWRTQA